MSLPDEPSAAEAVGDDAEPVPDDPAQQTVVVMQSEQQRLEAAEFLVATRVQEQVRRRVARAAMDVRALKRDELAEAIHQPPAD